MAKMNNTFWNRKKNDWYNYHKEENGNPDPYGWSQKELADALGYTVEAVQSWFSGRLVPGEKACEDICNFFDIDPERGMDMFLADHNDYVKAHNNPDQVTIEDVTNDRDHVWETKVVCEPTKEPTDEYLSLDKKGRCKFIFNKLIDAMNDDYDVENICMLVQRYARTNGSSMTCRDGSSLWAYALGLILYQHDFTYEEHNAIYEVIRPYILAEKEESKK